MSDNCKEIFRLNIGLNNCCGKKKEKNRDKCKPNKCVILPVCEPVECLPEGGEPGDHLVKDGDNHPIWKPANECDCEPGDHLPDGGAPNDFLARDGDNKPVWKPIDKCNCEQGDHLPDGGEPNDVLTRDGDNKPVWKPIDECNCEPVNCLPEGGNPNDVLAQDENGNPVWKPIDECDCEQGDHLPDGGEPNDVLARDGDNNPVWKPIDECNCEPVNCLPEGGNPNDVLTQDEDGNPVWKPIDECDCEQGDHLPDGGEPNDVLTRDGDNKPVWKPIDECTCEPVNGLPEGGNPNDVLAQDEDGNPVWKPINMCDCVTMDYLPTPSTGALRNDLGCTQVEDPIEDKDATPKKWVVDHVKEKMVTGLPAGGNPGDLLTKNSNNNPVWMPGKITPTAAQKFYVRTDGDDENTGLVNSAAGGFKTINGAITAILTRQHTSPYPITINVGKGTFDGSLTLNALSLSSVAVNIAGTSAASTIISGTHNVSTVFNQSGLLNITNACVTLNADDAVNEPAAIYAAGGNVSVDKVKVVLAINGSSTNNASFFTATNGVLSIGNITELSLNGTAYTIFRASGNASLSLNSGAIININNVAAQYCASSDNYSLILNRGATLKVGNNVPITYRYLVSHFGSIQVRGGGENYFPGINPGRVISSSYGLYEG